MNNRERRTALNEARQKAVDFARRAEISVFPDTNGYPIDSAIGEVYLMHSAMWAQVAACMKVGAASNDGVMDEGINNRPGIMTPH